MLIITSDKDFFPKELWPTISGESGKGNQKAEKRKELLLSSKLSGKTEEERRAAIAKLTEGIDENELDDETMRDPDDPEDEEVDDDYEGAEGEMGGDYDAEQYFDNGEDEDEDGGGGGGDGDGDY